MRRSRTLRSALALTLALTALAWPSWSLAASLSELKAQAQSAGLSPGSGGAGEQAEHRQQMQALAAAAFADDAEYLSPVDLKIDPLDDRDAIARGPKRYSQI